MQEDAFDKKDAVSVSNGKKAASGSRVAANDALAAENQKSSDALLDAEAQKLAAVNAEVSKKSYSF